VPAQGITLWRSKRDGKPRGFFRASWREHGRKITWDTRTLDKDEAQARAVAELNRRLSVAPPQPERALRDRDPVAASREPPVQPSHPAPPATTTTTSVADGFTPPGGFTRKPIGDALTRALTNGAAAATAPASSLPADAEETKRKARKLYEVFGKALGYLTEGGLKRACRWAGREPEDMDDDEIALVREGWEEKGADWFGKTNIGPWGKIALGSAVAGVGMYMGGKPIPKAPKAIPAPAPAGGANERLEPKVGGGGG
jgi:hypothetical protein